MLVAASHSPPRIARGRALSGVWVRDKDTTKLLLETKSLLRPIAWLSGDELLAAYSEEEGSISQGYPVPVKLIRVSRDGQRRLCLNNGH